MCSCISFDSYIKPQLIYNFLLFFTVVYLLIPTSNHNIELSHSNRFTLYIFWFLHQTTTITCDTALVRCCISFDSYIKPQPDVTARQIKLVVYLLIPTSNHNYDCFVDVFYSLYIFWFLHQTTTGNHLLSKLISCISFDSYIKPQQ